MYYRLYIRYHEHDNNYLEICRCYRSIYETEAVAADPEQWQPVSGAPFAAAVCRCIRKSIPSGVCGARGI